MDNYLTKVLRIWHFIFSEDAILFSSTDAYTVTILETLAPGLSTDDCASVRHGMSSGVLFPQVSSHSTRSRILVQLESIREPILSLTTFFEDCKLLELGMKPLRLLLPPISRASRANLSLRARLSARRAATADVHPLVLQKSEHNFVSVQCPSNSAVPLAVCQLFLHNLRHFESMTGLTPRKERGKPKPVSAAMPEKACWALADLAHRLGFSSSQIDHLRSQNPELHIVSDFLLRLRPEEEYEYPSEARLELARLVCDKVDLITRSQAARSQPLFTYDLHAQPKAHRYGRPHEDAHRSDRNYLYLDHIYGPFTATPARNLTSLGVKRFTIRAFFGELILPQLDGETQLLGPVDSNINIVGFNSDSERRQHSEHSSPRDSEPGQRVPGEQAPPMRASGQPPDQVTTHPVFEPVSTPGPAFHSVPAGSSLRRFVQERNQGGDMILILAVDRHYASFSCDEDGRVAFGDVTQRLANRQRCFWVVEADSRVRTSSIVGLWDNAMQFRLVIVVEKSGQESTQRTPYSGRSLTGLLDSLDARP